MNTNLLNQQPASDAFPAGSVTPPRRRDAPVPGGALAAALDLMPNPVFFLNASLQIVEANAAAVRRSARRLGELRGRRLEDVLTDDASGRLTTGLDRLLRGEAVTRRIPARQLQQGRRWQPVQVEFRVVAHEGESLLVAVVHTCDDGFAGSSQPESCCDYLTALPARAALEARLCGVERRAQRQDNPFAVLFIDVDRFKPINDTHGHRIGDFVLRTCGQRLLACVRPADFVARYGGDEFVALVENVGDTSEVEKIAERIRVELHRPIEIEGRSLRISVSVGVSIGDVGSSAQAILDRADQAMYRAKRALGAQRSAV